MARWSTDRLLTMEALEKVMKKTAMGAATEIAKKTARVLKNNIDSELYGRKHVTGTSNSYRIHYGNSTKPLVKAVFSENAVYEGDFYKSEVGFDYGTLLGYSDKKSSQYLGRYTDVHGNFVGDDMIEEGWLEEGSGGIVPRNGAYFMEKTEEEINDWISSGGINGEIMRNMMTLEITVEKE